MANRYQNNFNISHFFFPISLIDNVTLSKKQFKAQVTYATVDDSGSFKKMCKQTHRYFEESPGIDEQTAVSPFSSFIVETLI